MISDNDALLKVAVQKCGRLHNNTINLIKKCGIKLNPIKQLKIKAVNFPLEIYLLRDDDIPQLLEDGVADIGIIGKNIYLEKEKNIILIDELGICKCNLSIAFPKEFNYKGIWDLNGKRIATSYPRLLKNFLIQNKINAYIQKLSGSVEIAPSIGLADCICDLVSSGETLFRNGLIENIIILECEAVLAANENINKKENLLNKLLLRIQSVKTAKNNKVLITNIHNMQLPNIACLLPGMTNITPLYKTNLSNVQAVIEEKDLWYIIEKLKENGAKDILVLPIDNLIVNNFDYESRYY